jgi:diguanylate cyclase (GGDEF)-like protein
MILPGFAELDSESRLEAMHFALCENLFDCNGQQLRVTCSLGAAWYLPGQDSIRSLIERADQALYAAKANGRNRVEVG